MASNYFQAFDEKAWEWRERFSDVAVRTAIEETEAKFRVAAIELTRGSEQTPWGPALMKSIKTNHEFFADARQVLKEDKELATGRRRNDNPQQTPRTPAAKAEAKGTIKVKQEDAEDGPATTRKGSGPKTATHDGQRRVICKAVNDRRGCTGMKGKCPKGHVHCCDVVLASSGTACGSTAHARRGHREAQHGKWVPTSE